MLKYDFIEEHWPVVHYSNSTTNHMKCFFSLVSMQIL
uniref:Uncharacterized protein n=1 Tax=Setaria italica TaxID=4555 RepID=K3Y440_SETIT